MTIVALNRSNLGKVQPPVRVPGYDSAKITPGIVHLGLGNFHRAHMARYTHALMERRSDQRDWGIIGAGLLPADERMRDSLAPQDGLYTLVERSAAEERVSIIGSVVRVIHAGASSAALLDAISQPKIRIVSLTVTENGYCLNRATKQLDPDHPLVRGDLAEPAQPRSAVGVIVEAYRRRKDAGQPAFTALSCDNIQHNGNVLRAAALALAALRDPALASWIERHASFPNTMVDRITPVTAPEDVAALASRYGIDDAWPVFCETFTQWVIEDRFVQGRPAWEEVGAQFVPDVTPYEFMKLRLLNGSHLAVAGLGRLAGYVYVHEAMADPLLRRYMA
ncbi:MAG TPA: mannitol dehydrogenase family protein, partial [Acetobacteraceae bacterium]|nr:mannitol dehydrogenase family protein [Acetobacteraceae bacterium]